VGVAIAEETTSKEIKDAQEFSRSEPNGTAYVALSRVARSTRVPNSYSKIEAVQRLSDGTTRLRVKDAHTRGPNIHVLTSDWPLGIVPEDHQRTGRGRTPTAHLALFLSLCFRRRYLISS
jgi:hypothetical protein